MICGMADDETTRDDDLEIIRQALARVQQADREHADERAYEQLSEAELRAAEMFKMTPSEYLRFKSVRP